MVEQDRRWERDETGRTTVVDPAERPDHQPVNEIRLAAQRCGRDHQNPETD